MASDRDAEGLEQAPESEKPQWSKTVVSLASDPSTGMATALGLILAKQECPASVECQSCCKTPLTPIPYTPLMRPPARSGGCVPTARWMEHVAQAQGLGRTGVEGMVIPVSANCVAHQLTQPDAMRVWAKQPGSLAGLGKTLSGHAPGEALGRT